jgi:Recombinase/Resolvase, N terminal domain
LKHRKQLIINGKDYEKNPENKFTLTIFGAVAEFERAKIIERVTRGKQLRLAQGQLLGCGVHTFGYDYIRKTPTSRPQMIINEREAQIVRYLFETYAREQIGLDRIAKRLKDMGALTKTGKKLWRRSFLKTVLRNEDNDVCSEIAARAAPPPDQTGISGTQGPLTPTAGVVGTSDTQAGVSEPRTRAFERSR